MKTGTTTLNRALSILGYRVSHNSWQWLYSIMRNDWEKVSKLALEWDALEDNPIPLIYKELDQLFPNSKFILSTRESDAWYQSVSYHIGNLISPMHEWLFGLGKGLPMKDKNHAIAVYETHQKAVRDYFQSRPNDLLIIDVTKTQNWDAICTFLGEPIPKEAFPHANQSAYNSNKHGGLFKTLKLWKKRLLNPIKVWWFNRNGYIPTPQHRLQNL